MPPPADPVGILFGDYSTGMRHEFCAAELGNVNVTSCRLPTAAERDAATLGNAMLQWDSSVAPSARAFRYNRFISRRTSAAVAMLAAATKTVMAGKAMTISFGGYLFALSDSRLTYSGHLDLAAMLACPDLDMIASPYAYSVQSREPAGRLTAHGPVDSATLHGKAWVVEDDSRTVLTRPGTWGRYVNTTAETVNLLRQNMYTAMLHKMATYWLDLVIETQTNNHALGNFFKKTKFIRDNRERTLIHDAARRKQSGPIYQRLISLWNCVLMLKFDFLK